MTEVKIAAELKAKCPNAALGCVQAEVKTGATPIGLDEALRACEERITKLPEPRAVLEASAIAATRVGYKALGKDPARYRGSAEALLRRLISGKGMPRINNVVDVINLVSVESRMPVGLYDMAHVKGAVEFRAGRAGETYKGIGKYDLNLEGLPLFADAKSPHGSPTSDSERLGSAGRSRSGSAPERSRSASGLGEFCRASAPDFVCGVAGVVGVAV